MKPKHTDFSKAVIFADKNASAAERKAVMVLADEIFKRTGIKLKTEVMFPHSAEAVIAVGGSWLPCIPAVALVNGLPKSGSEGYRLATSNQDKPFCAVIGEDERGVLYGVGKLLRIMDWGAGRFTLPLDFSVSTAPRFPIRGHQLAYRPKTNAYDAWTPEIFDQYIRELALFGANTIDILPPGTDDADKNCLMKYDPLEMTRNLSEIIHSYGLECGMWYPNMFGEDISEQDFIRSKRSATMFSPLFLIWTTCLFRAETPAGSSRGNCLKCPKNSPLPQKNTTATSKFGFRPKLSARAKHGRKNSTRNWPKSPNGFTE